MISCTVVYPKRKDCAIVLYESPVARNLKQLNKLLLFLENLCKEKWKSLRDGYHRCLKKRKCKSGDGASKIKKWKFENQMEFLQQHLYERKTKDNFGDAESITSDDVTNENSPPEIAPLSPEPANSLSSSSATSTMFKKISTRKKNKQVSHQ